MKALRLPEQKIPNARRFWSRRYFIKNDGNQSINERRIEEAAFDPEMTANGADAGRPLIFDKRPLWGEFKPLRS